MSLWRTIEGALMSLPERKWLKRTAALINAKFPLPLILNIGMYKGASMHCLRAGAPDAVLVGIDVASRMVPAPQVLRAELLYGDSRHLGPKWKRPIHLLFVDGGHRYEVVCADILNFGKHVVLEGIVAFHDYSPSVEYLTTRRRRWPGRAPLGVKRAANELCTLKRGWESLEGVDSIGAFRRVE